MATEILSSLSSESVEKIVVGKFTLTKKKKTGNNSSSLLQNSTTPNNNGENLIRKGASVIRQDEILKKSKQQSKQDTTKTDIKLDHISYKFKKLQIQRKDAVNRHLHGDPQPASSEQTARFKKGHRINQDEKYYKKPRNIARQSAAQSSSSNLNPKDELPPPETTVTNPLVRITLRGYYKAKILPDLLPPSPHSTFLATLTTNLSTDIKDMSLHPFGSTVNNLGLQSSDVDLTLLAKITINKLANSLRKHYSDVFAIGHARVPIIKFRDGGLEVDINLNRMLGVYNSELLASYTYLDSRVKALIMLVKGFVKRREVGDASKGGLSSYSWSLMVLAFLMDRKVIRNLQGDGEEFVKTVNRGKSEMVNIAFEKVEEKIFDFDSIDFESDDGVAQLFFDFLYYVGYTHTLDNVFSIKDGGIVKATLKKYANKMVVLDPFEKDRNCAGSLRNKGDIQRVINACRQELHSLLN